MDFSIIIQRLNELTTFMNNVRTLSKKIFQLPPSTEGIKWVAAYNDTSQETEKFNLTDALNGMYSLTNGITAIGNIVRDGADFTFEVGFEWKINGIEYANAEITRTINDAGTGNHRIDIAVCDTNDDIYIIEGFEVGLTTAVVQPPTPPNTLFICSFLITESVIGDNSNPGLTIQNNIPLKIEILSTDLPTDDINGFVEYFNELNPPLTISETTSLVQFFCTDTEKIYQLTGVGKGVYGLSSTQITSANVILFVTSGGVGNVPTLQQVLDEGTDATVGNNTVDFNSTDSGGGIIFESRIGAQSSNVYIEEALLQLACLNETSGKNGSLLIANGNFSINQSNNDGTDTTTVIIEDPIADTTWIVPAKTAGNYEFASSDDIPPAITIDATPTDGSANAVSSNGVFDALALKQNVVSGVSDTEIGYLDGVRSSIQAQIDALRLPIAIDTGNRTHTGTVIETVVASLRIPANSLDAVCNLFMPLDYGKTSGGTVPIRLYRNTTNSRTDATQIALYNTGSNRNGGFLRKMLVRGTSLDLLSSATTSLISNMNVDLLFTATDTQVIAPSGDIWILVTVALDATGTVFTTKTFTIEKQKLG